jgi:cobalamin biosynthesis protein CbiG
LKSIVAVVAAAGSVIPIEKGHEGMRMVADLYATMGNNKR